MAFSMWDGGGGGGVSVVDVSRLSGCVITIHTDILGSQQESQAECTGPRRLGQWFSNKAV